MEFPSDIVPVSDNSEPETVSQEKEVGLDDNNIDEVQESCETSDSLPENCAEVGPPPLHLDPEADVDTCTLKLLSGNCELVENCLGENETFVSTLETSNCEESDSTVPSSLPKVTPPALDQEALKVSCLNDPEDIELNSPVSEDVVPVEDTILENSVPVNSAEVAGALASDPMLLVNSDELNSEEMTLTDDQDVVESDHVLTVDVSELPMPLHGTDSGGKSSLPACDTESSEAQNSPVVCGELEDLCSQKLLALNCETNAECELISLNFSDGVVVGNLKNCSQLSTPGNENTSAAADSSLSLLLPSPPDSPPILSDILPSSSLLLPTSSCCNDGSVSPLAPAEWCQHCGVLAPTDSASPDECLLSENCVENVRGPLEHLPGCRFYEEFEIGLEFAVNDVTSAELRSDTNVPNSRVEAPCILGESCGDAELDPASVKNCDIITDNSVEGVISNGQKCAINEDADNKSNIEGADVMKEVDDGEPEALSGVEREVFAIDDLKVTAEVEASSPVDEVASVAQTSEDLTRDSPLTVSKSSDQEVLETENDSLPEGLIDNETSTTSLSPLAEESEHLICSTNVSCDESNRNGSTAECEVQTGTEASNETMSLNDTQILDSEVASAIALGLESLETEHDDEDDFEESSGNAMSLLPDNSYSIGSQSPSSVSGDATCHTSNSLTDFSSTKCILQDSDSCGPSPEPTDAIDISCGISVLFEKCKNRRDLNILSCSSSKIDKTSRSMVATSESVSSQIERCTITGNESHISTTHLSKDESYKSDFTECASATSSPPNFSKSVNVAANLSPDRKYGVSFSSGNGPIVEETDDELHQSAKAENPAKNFLFKLPHDKAQNFKNPSLEHVVTTSAPCSPVPQSHRAQSMAGVASRKRKGNCVRRRVSFPENDMQLITSYLEPVDPWERMKRSVNSDEVLRAYMTSCRSHGCQPMPIVTNQIAALPLNVPGRVECFSLRGCKLELSQCEGLEEIFKRVQFVCIDLENCSLSDDTVIPLLDMIEFYDSTTHLNISGNSNIGMRGWQACSRMLKKNQSVRSLNARGTNLNEVNMPILGKALKLGSRLHTLHLENCNLTGRPLINLTAALKLNDTVVKLYLADNRLGANDCIQIGNLMRTNLTLKLLDLRNNNLQDIGCAHVCEGIAEQSKSKLLIEADSATDKQNVKKWGLNSLVLWNNHMTVSSAKHLAAMLLGSTSIETLNVGRNSVSNDGAIRLKEALLRNKSLKRLYLHATKIGDEGAVALAELLAESKNIERVDLRENTIKVAGLMALAHSLRHNTSMVQMDLDSNPRLEPLEELAERHVSLLLEIKEYTQRNRTEVQAHLASTESKEADSEDYYLDPDFRKLSLSSEIDGSQTLEIHTATPPNRAVSIALGSGLSSEEPKKYRSPSPSPCASPVPSPSLSPVPPTPFKNRFKVFKVSSASSPSGSCIVTANPIYAGNGSNALPSSAFPNLSSSAPSSSLPTPIISTTSRPIVHHPQPAGRNRFLSGGGRFTVTKVSDTNIHQASSIMKSKSLSLPQIPLMEPVKETEPSSPKIVISSPAKIERGFSLEESPAEGKHSSISAVSQPRVSNEDACGASAAKNRTDSAESDDVFVDSFSQSEANPSLSLRADQKTTGAVLSPVSKSRRDLTDSGFLEETGTDFEDTVANLSIGPARDSDRDSLFSNTSDPDGHSPVSPFPPSDSVKTSSASSNLPEATTFTPASNPPNSNSGEFLSSLPSRLGALFRGADRSTSLHLKLQSSSVSENKSLDRSPSCATEITSQPKRAPLASMENGSMDTDSEDSEVTTQSSDSTHSDEVRITSVEAAVEPVQAWGGDEARVLSNSDLEGLSTKNVDTEKCGAEEFLRDSGHDKTQPEVKKESSEFTAQIPDAKHIVEPILTDP